MNLYFYPAAAAGLSWQLLFAVGVFFLLSLGIVSRILPFRLGYVVVVIKYAIVLSYFAWWSDGSWHIGGDDSGYFDVGRRLLEDGHNPLSIWLSPVGNYILLGAPSAAIYHWWNMVWMYFFGQNYFAPVVANVFITFISAYVFDRILQTLEFSKIYRYGFAIYFLLNFKVIAWSSFLNLKEPLVVFLLLMTVYSLLRVIQKDWRFVPLVGICVVSFFGIRFYFPALLGAATIAYCLLVSKRKFITTALSACVLSLIFWKYWVTLGLVERLVDTSPVSVTKHLLKQFISPLPWSITEPATYLIIPSITQLFLLPAGIIGMVSFWLSARPRETKLIVLFFAAGWVFYGFIVGLSSPRHASVIGMLWVLFEFHFIFVCFKYGLKEFMRSPKALFKCT